MSLEIQPISFEEACRFITKHHRHHIPPLSWKFGCAVNDGTKVVGVVTVGRPVSRVLDDGWTLEVTRCCTDGTKYAASMLYAAAWRAGRALGYKRMITYTLLEERGTSLQAAGWKELYKTKGGTWNTPSRPRVDKASTNQKILWEVWKMIDLEAIEYRLKEYQKHPKGMYVADLISQDIPDLIREVKRLRQEVKKVKDEQSNLHSTPLVR